MDLRQTKRVLYLLSTRFVLIIQFVEHSRVFKSQVASFERAFEKLPLSQFPPYNHLKQRILYLKGLTYPFLKVEQM